MKGLEDSMEDFTVEYVLKFLQKIRKDKIDLPSIEYLIKFLPFIKSREYSDSFRKDGLWKIQGRPNKINQILEQNPDTDFLNKDIKKIIIEQNSKALYYRLLKKWKGVKNE